MAKRKSANSFNMSGEIVELLQANRKASIGEVREALAAKYPSAKINDGSFSVAFYNGRNKLGIKSGKRRGKSAAKAKNKSRASMDMHALQIAARFLSDVGGTAAALEAIKQVQALQVK